jgi:signal transduction histidine kinase
VTDKLASVLRDFALGFGGRAGLAIDVGIDTKINRGSDQVVMPLIRIFQESLTNVYRHAEADSVKVRLDVSNGWIDLKIQDDGIGIAADHIMTENGGLGLRGMCDRIERLGGTLKIDGDAGTCVCATIPIA